MLHTTSGRVRISIPGKGTYDAARASVTNRGIVLTGPVGFAINEKGPFIGAVDLNSVLYIDRSGVTKVGGDSALMRETTLNDDAGQAGKDLPVSEPADKVPANEQPSSPASKEGPR